MSGVRCRRGVGRIGQLADRSLTFSRPHGAVAIGDFALNDSGPERPLTGVVGGLDQPGMIQEGEKLIVSSADLGLKRAGQVTRARSRQDISQLPLQGPVLGQEGRGRQRGDPLG